MFVYVKVYVRLVRWFLSYAYQVFGELRQVGLNRWGIQYAIHASGVDVACAPITVMERSGLRRLSFCGVNVANPSIVVSRFVRYFNLHQQVIVRMIVV